MKRSNRYAIASSSSSREIERVKRDLTLITDAQDPRDPILLEMSVESRVLSAQEIQRVKRSKEGQKSTPEQVCLFQQDHVNIRAMGAKNIHPSRSFFFAFIRVFFI